MNAPATNAAGSESRLVKVLDDLRPRSARRGRLVDRNRARFQLEALEGRALLTAGALDSSFGNGGYVTNSSLTPSAVAAVQPWDGKTILVGFDSKSAGVSRYNTDGTLDLSFGAGGLATPDGSLDTTFGSNGLTLASLGSNHDSMVTSLITQSDGSILAIGTVDPLH
jgi:hypothetical protein